MAGCVIHSETFAIAFAFVNSLIYFYTSWTSL